MGADERTCTIELNLVPGIGAARSAALVAAMAQQGAVTSDYLPGTERIR